MDAGWQRGDKHHGFIAFTDAHFSVFWDHVEHVCESLPDVINPNRELAAFVDQMQGETAAQIVNLGDAVDYAFDGYDRGVQQVDNRAAFYAAIAPIADRYSEILGNHDVRRAAYNLRAWGLEHINLERARLTALGDRIGHMRLRSPLRELRAIAPLGPGGRPPPGFRGPSSPDHRTIGGLDCILLNTRGDGFLSPAGLGRMAARAMSGAIGQMPRTLSIPGYGLTSADLAALAGLSPPGDGPLLHLAHCPVVNAAEDLRGQSVALSLATFDRDRRRYGLDHHAMAHGGAGMLAYLRARALGEDGRPPRSTVVLAGHTHSTRYYLIEAERLILREVDWAEFNHAWLDSRYIKHATILPLGVIDPHNARPRLGYTHVGPEGLTEVVTAEFRPSATPARKLQRTEPFSAVAGHPA